MSRYVYVASSWRNSLQPAVCARLAAAGVEHYDFKNPPTGTGFSWRDVRPPDADEPRLKAKGADWESAADYLAMVHHPVATAGFESDYNAMKRADTFVLVLPCGKSAHLELGWAAGAGKRTAILLEDPVEPELMYRMADFMTADVDELIAWVRRPTSLSELLRSIPSALLHPPANRPGPADTSPEITYTCRCSFALCDAPAVARTGHPAGGIAVCDRHRRLFLDSELRPIYATGGVVRGPGLRVVGE